MMKVLAILGLLASTVACGSDSYNQFAPDNDLYLQDCLNCESAGGVNEQEFKDIIQAGMDIYSPIAEANNETLIINGKWTDSTVNANCQRSGGKVTVNQYGGLARRPEVNPAGFAIVMCHELGHAYAGAPYISMFSKMSAEGQSDYYSTKECFDKIQALVPKLQVKQDFYENYINENCIDKSSETSDIRCLNGLDGSHALGNLLATLMEEPLPAFETPDPTVVTVTELSYPATVQCRLDTYAAGIFKAKRPACWFKN